jgi:hypothetical protein
MYEAADGASEPNKWQITGGMPEYNFYWGSYIYDVADGTATLVELKDGTIWVGAKAGEYIIHMNHQGKDFLIYQGKIKGLLTPADNDGGYVAPEPDEPENEGGEGACGCDCDGCKDCTGGSGDSETDTFKGEMLTQLLASQQQYEQYKQMVLQFATEGVTAGQNNSYTGNGKVLMLTIHAEKGDAGVYIPEGIYNASDSTMEPNCWQITGGMPEYNFYWGTYLLEIADGKSTMVELKEGTVTVENGSITLESGAYRLRYTGEIPVIAL